MLIVDDEEDVEEEDEDADHYDHDHQGQVEVPMARGRAARSGLRFDEFEGFKGRFGQNSLEILGMGMGISNKKGR